MTKTEWLEKYAVVVNDQERIARDRSAEEDSTEFWWLIDHAKYEELFDDLTERFAELAHSAAQIFKEA